MQKFVREYYRICGISKVEKQKCEKQKHLVPVNMTYSNKTDSVHVDFDKYRWVVVKEFLIYIVIYNQSPCKYQVFTCGRRN